MASDQDQAFMRQAIKVMRDAGVVNKTGGPFGAVIVKDGAVIAAAGNSVIQDNDPSAQAAGPIAFGCQQPLQFPQGQRLRIALQGVLHLKRKPRCFFAVLKGGVSH
ncbi:hypothetical protein [Synechococcus sp. MU1611]|uniref:hypothetical protein n=1 Tax=Synechococcus sp. MU1611 TaxID=2508345 RepID=UPI001CF8DAEA|nr:hypothetical protein [Synechococcus sp. MU1611]MCB4410609.1 nucleoside deaminase [Synechococcus sp. MU1611]